MAIFTVVSSNGEVNEGVVTTSLNGVHYRNVPGDTYPDLRMMGAIADAKYRQRPFWMDTAAESGACASGYGAAAVISYPSVVKQRHVISGLAWSYNATPTAGYVSIESPPGNFIFRQDITSSGPGSIDFRDKNKAGAFGQPMLVTLGSPGGSIGGFLNVDSHWLE